MSACVKHTEPPRRLLQPAAGITINRRHEQCHSDYGSALAISEWWLWRVVASANFKLNLRDDLLFRLALSKTKAPGSVQLSPRRFTVSAE